MNDILPGGGMPWGYRKRGEKVMTGKTNEQRLEDLRVNTSYILSIINDGGDPERYVLRDICEDFIQLDISLLEGGSIPGAWGSAKLSKSKD